MSVIHRQSPKSRSALRGLAACAAALALGASGCTTMAGLFSGGQRVRDCEGFDVPLSVFNGASRKELRARVLAPGVDHDFPFVVEKTGESLVLVGFTPLGTKSFTLERKGDEVKVENFVGPALTVSPTNVMADVLAMSLPSSCSTAPEAVSTASYDGWTVDDTCHSSRPHLRHFRRTDAKEGAPAQVEIEIEYRDNEIVVRQKKCNYITRYVLQTVALPAVIKAGEAAGAAPAASAPPPAAAAVPAPAVAPAKPTSTSPPVSGPPSPAPPPTVSPAPVAPTAPAPASPTTSKPSN